MTRLEAWLLHVTTVLVTLTGLLYAQMHYLMKTRDPFSVVNHPWEPYVLDLHILIAPALLVVIGLIAHSHILLKLESGSRIGRRSGILLLPLFAIMVLSGYLLQIITAPWRSTVVIIHLVSGSIWSLSYVAHQISAYRMKRATAAQRPKIIEHAPY